MAKRVSLAKGLDEASLSGIEVFDLAENGDEIAVQAVESFYYYLAVGLYNLQTSIDPEIILLGGGISARNDLLEKIEAQFDFIFKRGQRMALRPEIARCKYLNDANLIGAVANFKRRKGSN